MASGIRMSLRNNIPEVERRLNRASQSCLQRLGGFIVSQAKLRCPVDTGYLRGSIGYKISSIFGFRRRLVLFVRASYAVFVHEGTRKMRPRRFLKDAVTENRLTIIDFIIQNYRSNF